MKHEELLSRARKELWAAWALSSDEIGSVAAEALIGLGMLVKPGGAQELEKLRAENAELVAAAYGDAEVRLWGPVEQIRHLHTALAAQLSRADTLDRLCREQRERADAAEARLGEYERPADEDPITYTLTAEADGITRRIAPTQALREDTPAALEPQPIVKATSARYAEELRRNPGKASADGHTGWQCGAGASLIVRAETPGPGKLGTHHGVIYACTEHQAAAVERIESAGYGPQVDPAPAGHRWDPWPCGHVTTFNSVALAALSGQRAAVEDPHDSPLHHPYRVGRDLPEMGGGAR